VSKNESDWAIAPNRQTFIDNDSTIEALEHAFPQKSIRDEKRSRPKFSQTALFTSEVKTKGEVDLLMW